MCAYAWCDAEQEQQITRTEDRGSSWKCDGGSMVWFCQVLGSWLFLRFEGNCTHFCSRSSQCKNSITHL